MRTNLIVVVALAVLASACRGGSTDEPNGPSEVRGNNVPPTVVATISPKIYDGMSEMQPTVTSGSRLEYTVKVGQDFIFRPNVFNPQAMGRHIHYEIQVTGLDLAPGGDGANRDFDEPQLPSSVGEFTLYRFYIPGDRTWKISLVETGGNLPTPTIVSASVTVHVVR